MNPHTGVDRKDKQTNRVRHRDRDRQTETETETQTETETETDPVRAAIGLQEE